MVRGQLWFWFACTKGDSSHSHRSRCSNGYNCCERAVLLWATAVAPSAGPKCGSKWTSKVYQQSTHGYMVSLTPQHVEWGKTVEYLFSATWMCQCQKKRNECFHVCMQLVLNPCTHHKFRKWWLLICTARNSLVVSTCLQCGVSVYK